MIINLRGRGVGGAAAVTAKAAFAGAWQSGPEGPESWLLPRAALATQVTRKPACGGAQRGAQPLVFGRPTLCGWQQQCPLLELLRLIRPEAPISRHGMRDKLTKFPFNLACGPDSNYFEAARFGCNWLSFRLALANLT